MYLPPLTSICSILRPLSPACGNQSCLRRPSALRNFSKYRLCTRPELRILNAAAQTRIVLVARIRLDSRKSVRPFKGIFCDDVSEFESYMPSHAVGSLRGTRGCMSANENALVLTAQSKRFGV